MRDIHAAVIGCGLISKNHFKSLENIKHVTCAAVCDIDGDKAQEAGALYGISKIYTDYRELLRDPGIDVVHICTPHYLHAPMAVEALQAGKHVLCEKPMALTAADCERMLEAEQLSERQLGICFQNRYNESSAYMKQLIDSGELGAVLGARGQVTWNREPEYYIGSPWRGKWKTAGGGVLINQAIHTFDLLQWLAGPVSTVEAGISTKRLKGTIEVEDTVDIYMTGESGERFVFYATNGYVRNAPVELEIICEHGSVTMKGNVVVTEKAGERFVKDYSEGIVLGKDYWGSGHGLLIDDFYQSVLQGEEFFVNGREAAASVRLLEAVYRSANMGMAIDL